MIRPATRRDTAAAVAAGCLGALDRVARPLLVDETSGQLAAALLALGADPVAWHRMASDGCAVPALAWPTGVSCDAAFVRLPPSRGALDFALHAAAACIPGGAPIVLFGMNDEGIRSATRQLDGVAETIATCETRRHARVLAGRRRMTLANPCSELRHWRRSAPITLPSGRVDWVSYPGVFAKGGLDPGTALLLANLPVVPPGARVLDFAAGTGVIAHAVLAQSPTAEVDMIEADAVAVAAARENVASANAMIGTSLTAAAGRRYRLVLSNPPIHDGVAEDHTVLSRLIAEVPRYLVAGGEFRLVVQRRVAVAAAIEAAFGTSTVVADNGRFTVFSAIAPLPAPAARSVRARTQARPDG